MNVRHGQGVGKELPVATCITLIWCVITFIGVNAGLDRGWEGVAKFGYFPETSVYQGNYISLITSAFVHVEFLHLVFNLYWLWILGGAFEHTFGPVRWVVFVLAAAFVSSGWQMWSGEMGIGFSGVGYAFFGFGMIGRKRYPEIAKVVNPQIIRLFIGWGIFCIVVTSLGLMNIGNWAHAAGLAFGAALGLFLTDQRWKAAMAGALVAMAFGAVTPITWNPRSKYWVSEQAIDAFKQHNWTEAVRLYKRSMNLGADPAWAWFSLGEIYGITDDRANYVIAVAELERIDPKQAQELIGEFGAAQVTTPDDKASNKQQRP